ncbi:MAG: hypothetical protein AB7Q23_06650 [Hyphomonadaceae bacterium]
MGQLLSKLTAILTLVLACALVAPRYASAQEDSPQTADEAAVEWTVRTLGRWQTIHSIIVAQIGRIPSVGFESTEAEQQEARDRVRALRRDFDQALAALRADIVAAGPPPDAHFYQEARLAAAVLATPARQLELLDRVAALSARDEELFVAAVGRRDVTMRPFGVSLRGLFRESVAIFVELLRIDRARLGPGNPAVDLWLELSELDARGTLANHDMWIAVMLGRPEQLAVARAEAQQVIEQLHARLPDLRVLSTLRPPMVEGVIDPERAAQFERFTRALPHLPEVAVAHLSEIERYVVLWPSFTVADALDAESGDWPSLMVRLMEYADSLPPPPT